MSKLIAGEYKSSKDIKEIRPDENEFWSAGELAPAWEYNKWENFLR
jgi:DNA-damage-inducible protein D